MNSRRALSAGLIVMAAGFTALLAAACTTQMSPTAATAMGGASAATAMGGPSASTLAETRSSKVDVCHREGQGGFHLINVSTNAMNAHLGHGDGLVGQPVPGQPGKIFGPACEVLDETGPCTYVLTGPTTRSVQACSAGSGIAVVTVKHGCTWSVTSNSGWLTVGSGTHVGTGSGQNINYSYVNNYHQDARTGQITVLDGGSNPTGVVLTINQVSGHTCQ